MQFCQDHWGALRAAIQAQGLNHLVATGGAEVAGYLAGEIKEGQTAQNYEPLLGSYFAIAGNVMSQIEASGNNPVYLLGDGPEDAVEGYGPRFKGRTWPRCPLCYLNLAHEASCKDPRCQLDRERGYDFFIQRAAHEAKQRAAELGILDPALARLARSGPPSGG